MQPTQLRVKSLAHDLAVTHEDRANQGIRTNSTASALSQLQRSAQMSLIRGCDLAVHRTD
jgi:hypothetical protein